MRHASWIHDHFIKKRSDGLTPYGRHKLRSYDKAIVPFGETVCWRDPAKVKFKFLSVDVGGLDRAFIEANVYADPETACKALQEFETGGVVADAGYDNSGGYDNTGGYDNHGGYDGQSGYDQVYAYGNTGYDAVQPPPTSHHAMGHSDSIAERSAESTSTAQRL